MFLQSNTKNLIKSILFLIFGALIFAYPDTVISIVASGFGAILILYGLFMIIKNYYETKQNSETPATLLTFGIILLLVGITFIILSDSISLVIQYVLGAWILFNGIEKLLLSFSLPKGSTQFKSQLVISILLLAAGLYTILVANITIQVVGLIMMIYAVLEIIGAITNKKIVEQEIKEVKEEKTALVEKEETKEKKTKGRGKSKGKVKEAKVVEDKSDEK